MQNLIPYLIQNGRTWVVLERARYHPQGTPLDAPFRELFDPFFEIPTLDRARICLVPRIDNPPFYRELERSGIAMPLDFSSMAGITFIDTILISRAEASFEPSERLALLFHECVHVAQYLHLGLDRFIQQYVEGWAANGFEYSSIPLERHAYDLQNRFTASPREPFSVDESVRASFP